MSAHRITRDAADVRAAWEQAASSRQFFNRLRISYTPSAGARLCARHGLEWPAPHWGYRAAPQPELPDPAEQVDRDTELQRVKTERDSFKRLYDEALKRIRTQVDIVASIASQFARPLPPPRGVLAPRGLAL